MAWLPLVRLCVFGASILFSIIVLGLGAHLIAAGHNVVVDDGFFGFDVENVYFPFTGLAVAVAVIHLITVTPMLVIGFLRSGAFTSLVLVEVVWLSIMWVLWLAAGGLAASTVEFCGNSDFAVCQEGEAIAAFAFLTWFALMGYTVTLLTLAILAHKRGQSGVWMSPATDGVESTAPVHEKPVGMAPTAYAAPATHPYSSAQPSSVGTYSPAPMSVQRPPVAEV